VVGVQNWLVCIELGRIFIQSKAFTTGRFRGIHFGECLNAHNLKIKWPNWERAPKYAPGFNMF